MGGAARDFVARQTERTDAANYRKVSLAIKATDSLNTFFQMKKNLVVYGQLRLNYVEFF